MSRDIVKAWVPSQVSKNKACLRLDGLDGREGTAGRHVVRHRVHLDLKVFAERQALQDVRRLLDLLRRRPPLRRPVGLRHVSLVGRPWTVPAHLKPLDALSPTFLAIFSER